MTGRTFGTQFRRGAIVLSLVYAGIGLQACKEPAAPLSDIRGRWLGTTAEMRVHLNLFTAVDPTWGEYLTGDGSMVVLATGDSLEMYVPLIDGPTIHMTFGPAGLPFRSFIGRRAGPTELRGYLRHEAALLPDPNPDSVAITFVKQ